MKRKDRLQLTLLCDISELAALLVGSENIENFLQRTVEMVARHMGADVCSTYLFDEASAELVLRVTIGLNPAAIGHIRMKIGEGLVGITLEKLDPVNEGLASRHPKYKYFKEAGEDLFDSFLAVSILRGDEKIGVVVVQHKQRSFFDEIDVMTMRTIASQLAGAIGNARLLMSLDRQSAAGPLGPPMAALFRLIKGEVASAGYAFAPAAVFDKSHDTLVPDEVDEKYEYSLADFGRAVRATADQLEDLQYRFSRRLPESAALIFSAPLMILKDIHFAREMENLIKSGMSPPSAVKPVANQSELLQLVEGTPVLMDAEFGNIYVQPSEEIVDRFESQKQARLETQTLTGKMSAATYTRDGARIHLLANINLLCDLTLAKELKTEGVGLYRTEFPFLIRSEVLSEEEQFNVYKRLFDEMAGMEITIRTLDIGGDKLPACSDATAEANPELGLRAIRFSFQHRDVFHQQLRAILRAAAEAEKSGQNAESRQKTE